MADQSPLDLFKQALTGASRAIARDAEVEVAWSADVPGAAGNRFRVPLPGRDLPADQVTEARGFADSFALKLRHHNAALHATSTSASRAIARDAPVSACLNRSSGVWSAMLRGSIVRSWPNRP